jgi:hypothetical protein
MEAGFHRSIDAPIEVKRRERVPWEATLGRNSA